jgi:hypothetical protein
MPNRDRALLGMIAVALAAIACHYLDLFWFFNAFCIGGAIFTVASEGHTE